MLLIIPSGNDFECHLEVLYLQPMIPPKRFDLFPLTGGCSEGLDALVQIFLSSTIQQESVGIQNCISLPPQPDDSAIK